MIFLVIHDYSIRTELYKDQKLHDEALEFLGAMKVVGDQIKKLWDEAAKLERETFFVVMSDNGGAFFGKKWSKKTRDETDGCNWPYKELIIKNLDS